MACEAEVEQDAEDEQDDETRRYCDATTWQLASVPARVADALASDALATLLHSRRSVTN